EGARQQDGGHQARGRDRPQDEGPRRVHAPGLAAPLRSGARTWTALPPRSFSTPSTTTASSGARPVSIAVSVPVVGPTVTGRTSTVWSGFTTYTNVPCEPRCTAATGTMTAPLRTSSSSRTFTDRLGNSAPS